MGRIDAGVILFSAFNMRQVASEAQRLKDASAGLLVAVQDLERRTRPYRKKSKPRT